MKGFINYTILASIFIMLILISCRNNYKPKESIITNSSKILDSKLDYYSQKLPILDLIGSIKNPRNITLRDFVDSIIYIPLETSQECLVENNPHVIVTKKYLLIITSEKCLLFDRGSGSFIREIGHYGRDPGGFRNTFGVFNELSSTYYFISWNGNLIKYSLDGTYLGICKIPGFVDNIDSPSIPDRYSFLGEKLIVCNFINISGAKSKSLMIFNEEGEIIKIIPNRNIYKNKPSIISTREISFHRFNNSLFYQEFYNDTVFKISKDSTIPYFILERGSYRPPYESRWWPLTKRKQFEFISQPDYFENSSFITFRFFFYFSQTSYFAIFNKAQKSIKVFENKLGLKNDIDGFIDLTFNSLNESGELSCLIQAIEVSQWIKQNPDKFKALKPELQKFKETKLGDNPIVVIAKYKE